MVTAQAQKTPLHPLTRITATLQNYTSEWVRRVIIDDDSCDLEALREEALMAQWMSQ